MSSGSTCAVVGCSNNSRKLKQFMETECYIHKVIRTDCDCSAPYRLHTMPQNRKTEWLAALKLKHPPRKIYVCSYHFVNKRPTDDYPNPELYLGYERPLVKKRRTLVGVETTGKQLCKSTSR